ncbi:hypothetical protein JW859_00130 [bacterium]|nr:hypothetical protein [bacterium]
MRELLSGRWLWGWAIVLAFMAMVAWVSRARELDTLSARIATELQPYAEHNIEKQSAYGWRYNDYLWDYQGPMVYLIEHRHRDPALLRTMLLCEARRSYDHVYLYDRCLNWDLRQHLIAECAKAYPDDPLVHWATGRCLLAAGEFARAADELLAAERLGFDAESAGTRLEYFHGRIATALLMDDRPAEAIAHLKVWCDEDPADRERHFAYCELLTLLERYDESDAAIEQWRAAAGGDFRQHTLGLRNAWWSGNTVEFERRTLAAADEVTDFVLLDWAGIRYAVLYRKFDHARAVAGDRPDYYYRALAEAYALTGRVEYLDLLMAEADELAAAMARAEREENRSVYWDLRNQASAAQGNIMRAYLLSGEWDRLAALLAVEKPDSYARLYYGAYDLARVLLHLAGDGPNDEQWSQSCPQLDYPWVLYSDVLAEAARRGDWEVDAARRLLLGFYPVDRRSYFDSTNGELDW